MFKMGMILIGVAVLVSFYVIGNNYIVHTSDGYRLVEKKDFGFGETMQDTRKWGPTDWLKYPEITKSVAKEKWEDVKESVSEGWAEFSESFESHARSLDLDKLPEKAKAQYEDLRKTVRKKHDKLSKSMDDNDITADEFREKMHELNEWSAEQMDDLKKKFS